MKRKRNWSWKKWDMNLLQEQLREISKEYRGKVFVIHTSKKRVINSLLELEARYPQLFKSHGVYRSSMRIMKITPVTICFVARALKNHPLDVRLLIAEDKWMRHLPKCFDTLSEWNGDYKQLERRLNTYPHMGISAK